MEIIRHKRGRVLTPIIHQEGMLVKGDKNHCRRRRKSLENRFVKRRKKLKVHEKQKIPQYEKTM